MFHCLINSMEQSVFWEANSLLRCQEFFVFYGIQRSFTLFTKACLQSLFLVCWIQSTPFISVFLWILLILSSYQCLGLLSGLFFWDFPTKTLYKFLDLPMHAACPTYLMLLDLIVLIIAGEEYKLWSPLREVREIQTEILRFLWQRVWRWLSPGL